MSAKKEGGGSGGGMKVRPRRLAAALMAAAASMLGGAAVAADAWSPAPSPGVASTGRAKTPPPHPARPYPSPSSSGGGGAEAAVADADPPSPAAASVARTTAAAAPPDARKAAAAAASAGVVMGATALTFAMNNSGPAPLGPFRASGLTGLAAALVLPEELAGAALCGAFAGMARRAVISGPPAPASLLLGALCAAMMGLFNRKAWLVGVGGRLGHIAQCACTLQFLLSRMVSPVTSGAALVGAFPPTIKALTGLPAACACTVAGALTMSFWREAMAAQAERRASKTSLSSSSIQPFDLATSLCARLSTPVAAVSVTSLAASFFPAIAGPVFSGSVLAMSSPARLETYGAMIGAAVMGGVCQQAMSGVLVGGWGGRLGTAAVLGVLSYTAIVKAWSNVALSRKGPARKVAA